ncbi:hypothetical protein [Aeromonas sp. R5-2]|uniref:hypothetical protein n=1 Tax=Aeromonas sp. R5-2 TaxID=3138468 RepID=UPI0034A5C1CF
MELNPYPDFFPDGVPPEDALDAHGEAYRLVINNPPSESDFYAYHLDKRPQNPKPGRSDCGTSMFRSKEGIEQAKEAFKSLRKKKIAYGFLQPDFGKVSKERNDSHFEAWLRTNTGIENKFKVI